MEPYSTIPFNTQLPLFKFPEYVLLDINGIKTYLYSDKLATIVSIGVVFPFGTIGDTIDGIGSFSSSVIIKGTTTRTPSKLFKEIETLGAKLSSQINSDFYSLSISALSHNFKKCSEIIKDILINPTFLNNEIEIQKKKAIASIKLELSSPSTLADIAINSILYYLHPYSKFSMGKPEDIQNFNRQDCLEWYENNIRKFKPFIVIVGNFNSHSVINFINQIADIFGKNSIPVNKKIKLIKHDKRIAIINKSDAFQSSIRIGIHTIDRKHPNYSKLNLLNTILGGYFLSRLNKKLREELGLTYGVSSQIISKKKSNHLVICTEVNKETTKFALENIKAVISNLQNDVIDENEFLTARQYMIGSFFRSIESSQQVGSIIKGISAFDLPSDYYDRFFNSISNMKPDGLIHLQKEYMVPNKFFISIAGQLKEIEEQLSDYSGIIECNQYGEFIKN